MKICSECGEMISPYPIHKEVFGTCDTCTKELEESLERITGKPVFLGRNETDNSRPKIKGKHMIIQKSHAQILMEKRKKELGKRFY
ncbi:MAG: hypothetical protein M0Q91_16465 [Methanoregula sp.]|jgi:DNA-directed RNA polymerase subunit M/transcription elongation factor TFIIS|nr:hypothetical protein [Methanoregula sp.]